METQRKVFPTKVTKAPGDDPRVLRFVASTQDVDRDGDVIDVAGWELDDWFRNPVIMWAHDYSQPPIAKGIRAEKDLRNKQLIIDARFPTLQELAPEGEPSEHAKFIETIYQLYNTGCLNAVSVGCNYKECEKMSNASTSSDQLRYHVTKSSLMELSCCPIGANQNALRSASAMPGINKSALEMVVKSMGLIETKSAIPFKHYPLADEDTAWDGPKVVADCEVADLAKICAWKADKDEADLTKGDFKLPHHLTKSDGYKTVKAGVVAAAGALLGARGGVSIPGKDVEGTKAHIKRHYAEFDLTWPEDKAAWVAQAKSFGIDNIEQKAGRRLSADSLSKLDGIEAKLADFDKIMASIDEVQKTLSSARDEMVQLIHSLRDGEATEEPEPEVEEEQDGEKAVKATVIKIVG